MVEEMCNNLMKIFLLKWNTQKRMTTQKTKNKIKTKECNKNIVDPPEIGVDQLRE